ncbi:hypothetical protein JYU34_000634 [Plutella xylostella]|uniref:Integrase catalytic domain-containing protein n=1 Tax=Plutella xylostella TaxID=51655 RepID=A0ABQ7R874_PLUXY|nr:hypothetical protein JYU34_000634 [Plutella xylostella]
MDKRTTKCRTVFDGGMLSNKKVSLNDLQLNGPVVQRDLFDIVILFRLEKYIIISDIKHMFRAISLKPEHRPLQNILWRDSPDKPIDCIQLKTLTYGLKSSSYLATRCLIELAERYGDEFPKAAFVLKNQTYVDDILATADTLDSLIETKKQICSLLELGGFQLHKWSSNAPQVLHDIPIQNQYFDKVDLQEDNVCLKTLGINYDIKSDSLTLSAPRLEKKVPATKREILSFISKFFDPVGLAGPIVVGGKAIMQKVWKEHVGWDSPLSDPLMKEWNDFYNSLNIMGPIVISRFAHLDNSACIQLVGFVDASSSTAYGCCLYLRVVDTAGNVSISLLSSKSRVNPIKKELTVPRLELNAAVLLAKLAKRVHDILSLKVNVSNVVLYADSQIVLAWIATNVVTLNTYVANRVLLITQLTCGYTWAYVSTEHNPADCLSRGVAPHELQQHPLWWTASPCLHERDYFVPTYEPFSVDALPELRPYAELPMAMVSVNSDSIDINCNFLDKFSNITKMQRVLAYVLRFCNNARTKSVKRSDPFLTAAELDDSMSYILLYEQQKCMSDEIRLLRGKKPLKDNLMSLDPFLDDRGLIRVGGRLQNANISYSQKHQIILPKDSRVTKLIIKREHEKNLHAGQKIVLSSLNQKYWLLNGIREIKKVIHKCITCFKLKKEFSEQLMGSLPHDRVNVCRPFQKVGIDFAGPISVKQSTIRRSVISTGYIRVIVCFVTKAIHLEMVSDIKTDSFLACLKRFISRRGLPTDIFCDNASTFKSAKTQLHELFKQFNTKEHQSLVHSFASSKGITFHFIPCYSPVFGGLWESSVKSVKDHLKRVVQKALLTYEQLSTVLCQIEAVLNSRPLVPLSDDVNDYLYLTPGHFLIGTALNSYPEPDVSDVNVNRLRFWKICTNMQQSFWKIWNKYYLNSLQSRPKWKNVRDNLQIGQLVILRENNTPPMYWPMARITKVFPGTDNLVRAVEVRTSNGHTHKRSVTRMCALPVDDNGDK